MEVDRVRHRRLVRERDTHRLADTSVDHRAGRGAAERPRLVADARRDLQHAVRDGEVDGDHVAGRRGHEFGRIGLVRRGERVGVRRSHACEARRLGGRSRTGHAAHVVAGCCPRLDGGGLRVS
jgi:hypothetical protein